MLVSGGKIIAIDGVNTTSATLSGDGVFTPLGVNTDNVATKKFVTDNLNTVSSKLTNTDNYLSAAIDYVSANAGKTYKPGAGIEIDNNNVVSISSEYIDVITSVSSISGTVITGDSNFNITSAGSGKNIVWNLELTTQPVVTDTTLSGYNGIIARKDSTVSSQWNVGLNETYKSAIEQVSGKLDKSDSAKFYPMSGNPSGFITGIPTSSNWDSVYSTVNSNSGTWNNVSAKVDTTAMSAYYKKTETSSKEEIYNEFNATSAWANETFLPSGDYLSANALKDLSGKWESASNKVNDSAATWNTVTAKADQTDLETLSSNVENLSADVETISSKLDDKLDIQDFNDWSATIDTAFYSAGEGLALDNHTFSISAKYLSANALDNVSGNWNSVYNTVCSNSGNWNNLTSIKTFSSIGGVSAKNSADELLFEPGDNVSITTSNNTITFSAKDTTYDENDFISASHLDNIVSVSATVKSNSANWNDVSSKANSADLTALSSKVNNLSGELNTTSSFLSGAIEGVSAEFENVVYKSATADWDVTPYSAGQNINITDHIISGKDWTGTIEEASANAVTTVENKFNGENNTITAYGTSSFANDKYTAGEGLALNDHQFYVSGKYITSAGDTFAGKMLILKDNEWMEMPEFGGFATANSGAGHPDVQNPSTKLIYLVKNSSVTGNDKYSEWIYTSADAQTTAWECIGDTSLDLTPYLTKTSADTLYQQKGDYVTSSTEVISANKNYALTNDGTNVKWVELEDKDTTYSAGNYIEITNDNTINVSGLHNVTLSSSNDSVGITATTGVDGNVNYNLSVEEVFIPDISGYNGISARYNEEAQRYEVGIEEDDYAFLFGHYANNSTLTDGDIIKLDSNNYHDIVIDNDGYITLPASTNKFTFCINEYIDDNTNQNHEYLLNKLVLSAKNSDSIVASQNYYPSEVGSSNVTLALTIDDTAQKEYCIVYKGSDVPTNKIHIEASILEEVRSLDSSRGDVDDYTGREPIRVIQNARVVELLYDEDVFTLKADSSLGANKLSIVAAGGEVVNKETFDKLLNTINGRMTETIPFGALNQVASLAGKKQYAYLFRPTIEYDMTQNTVAYMFGGNHDGGERVSVAVYDSTKTSDNLIWRSDYPELNVGGGGEHTMQAHIDSPSGTIYPDHLYYVAVRIDKTDGGGSWNNVLGVPITNSTDVGNLRVWLGYDLPGNEDLNFPSSINFNTQGSLGNFGGLKPYVGFRTNIPND